MILSFLLAAAAGYAVPYAEPVLRRALAAALKVEIRFDATEMRVLTLLCLLVLSALLTLAMGAETSSLAMALGAALGVFGERLYAFLRDPDGTNVPDEERWDGRVRMPGEGPDNTAGQDGTSGPETPDEAALRAVDAALQADERPEAGAAPDKQTKEPLP